jgi:hypothetical protein
MTVLIAMDSMKGSLSSLEGGRAVADGVRRVFPDAVCDVRPLADGGEGTVDALVSGLGGTLRRVTVSDPLQRPVEAAYGIVGETAIIEMSAAAGLPLLADGERDPARATTFGVGEILNGGDGLGSEPGNLSRHIQSTIGRESAQHGVKRVCLDIRTGACEFHLLKPLCIKEKFPCPSILRPSLRGLRAQRRLDRLPRESGAPPQDA